MTFWAICSKQSFINIQNVQYSYDLGLIYTACIRYTNCIWFVYRRLYRHTMSWTQQRECCATSIEIIRLLFNIRHFGLLDFIEYDCFVCTNSILSAIFSSSPRSHAPFLCLYLPSRSLSLSSSLFHSLSLLLLPVFFLSISVTAVSITTFARLLHLIPISSHAMEHEQTTITFSSRHKFVHSHRWNSIAFLGQPINIGMLSCIGEICFPNVLGRCCCSNEQEYIAYQYYFYSFSVMRFHWAQSV